MLVMLDCYLGSFSHSATSAPPEEGSAAHGERDLDWECYNYEQDEDDRGP